jgi:hypothetical protein
MSQSTIVALVQNFLSTSTPSGVLMLVDID